MMYSNDKRNEGDQRPVDVEEPVSAQFCNLTVRNHFPGMELEEMSGHVSDNNMAIDFPAVKIQRWPGYVNGVPVIQTEDVLSVIKALQQSGQHWDVPEAISSALQQLLTMTDYNRSTYKVTGVDFELTLRSYLTPGTGHSITYKLFHLEIRDHGQSLLVVFDPRRNLKNECPNLITELVGWDLSFETEMLTLHGQVLPPQRSIIFALDTEVDHADWTYGFRNEKLLFSEPLNKWTPCTIKFPLQSLMVVGYDTYAETTPQISAMVSSLTATKYFSTIFSSTTYPEKIKKMCLQLKKCMIAYQRHNDNLPYWILMYRDEAEYDEVSEFEITAIEMCIADFYMAERMEAPKFTYVIFTKKINKRLFAEFREGDPSPGTIVDRTNTVSSKYEFFMVLTAARQGSACPTKYYVVRDTSAVEPDKLQLLTGKLCHEWFDWSGTVPALCQYALKLATLAAVAYERSA